MEAKVEIRPLTLKDAEAIYTITAQANPGHATWELATFQAELINNYNYYLGYVYNDEVIAYIGGMLIFDEASVNNFAVAPKWMRKGIGATLLQAFIRDCYEKGVRNFLLEVRPSNQRAIHLYKKYGFKKIDVRKNYYQEPMEDAYIFQLDK